MHSSTLLLSMAASTVIAVPYEDAAATLMKRLGAGAFMTGFQGNCDISSLKQPTDSGSSTQLPAPTGTLKQLVIGRGTQNYTCATSDSSSTPVPIGAIASLLSLNCLVAAAPSALDILPPLIIDIQHEFHRPNSPLHLLDFDLIGNHYFPDSSTAVFNLNTDNGQFGITFANKVETISPPADAPKGQFGRGDGAVTWVFLEANSTANPDKNAFSQVYRTNTAGGNAPETCQGQKAHFQRNYAAIYWFYE